MSPPRRRAWAAPLLAITLAALATRLGARGAGLQAGAGSDPDLWVFAAVDAAHGAGWPLPPLGPLLVAGLAGLGVAWHPGWLALSAVALPLVAGLATALAGRLGARPGLALAAGLGPLLLPTLASTAWQAGPDALTALVFLAAAGGAQGLAAPPHPPGHPGGKDRWPAGAALTLLALAGAMLVRELGPAVALAAALGAMAGASGSPRGRRVAPVLLLLCAALPAGLLGEALAPWDWRWMGRVLRDSQGLPPPKVPAWVLEVEGPARVLRRAAWTLRGQPEAWLLLGPGTVAALRRRWWSLALVQLCGFSALAVWSQPRHVAVLLPVSGVALAGWAVGAGARGRGLALGLALLAGAAAAPRWKGALTLAQEQAADARELAALGAALCARVGPGDLAGGEPRAFTFCPLPRHVPQAPPPAAADGTPSADAAAWATWHAGTPPTDLPWARVPLPSTRYDLYRLRPELEGAARPCARSRPAADSPRFPSPPRAAVVTPPCQAPVPGSATPSSSPRPRSRSAGRGAPAPPVAPSAE